MLKSQISRFPGKCIYQKSRFLGRLATHVAGHICRKPLYFKDLRTFWSILVRFGMVFDPPRYKDIQNAPFRLPKLFLHSYLLYELMVRMTVECSKKPINIGVFMYIY